MYFFYVFNFLSISRNVKILHNFFTFFDCVLSVVFVGYFNIFVSHKLRNHFISMPSAIRLQANVRLNACGRALSGSYIPTVAQYFFSTFSTPCAVIRVPSRLIKKCVVFCFFVFNTFLHICKQFVFHLDRHKYFLFVTALTGDNK